MDNYVIPAVIIFIRFAELPYSKLNNKPCCYFESYAILEMLQANSAGHVCNHFALSYGWPLSPKIQRM